MPTLKKKQSQNIFNTIKKIDKVAINPTGTSRIL